MDRIRPPEVGGGFDGDDRGGHWHWHEGGAAIVEEDLSRNVGERD
jgi:hypothetical protein